MVLPRRRLRRHLPELLMIGVCIKWLGTSDTAGVSAADEAAIEMALRHGEATRTTVIAVTVGGPASDHALRTALACGVATAIRVAAPDDLNSASVAEALTPVVAHSTAVWCGDYSADRGTGSVPAFLAARLQRQQALGLVGVDFTTPLRVTRRLDGGRREILRHHRTRRVVGRGIRCSPSPSLVALRSLGTGHRGVAVRHQHGAQGQHFDDRASLPPSGPRAAGTGRNDCARSSAGAHRCVRRAAAWRGRRGDPGGRSATDHRGAARLGLHEGVGVTIRLGDVTWTDLWRMAPRPIIAVPIGSCEQHGPHLPLDTDTRIAIALAEGMAASFDPGDVLVGPCAHRDAPAASTPAFPARCRSAPMSSST